MISSSRIILLFIVAGCSVKTNHDITTDYSSNLECDTSPPLSNDTPVDGTFYFPSDTTECSSSTYELQIDRRFLCDPKESILSAWSSWAAVLQGKVNVVIRYPDQIDNSFEPCTIKVYRRTLTQGAPGITVSLIQENNKPSTARFSLDPSLTGDFERLAAVHEFGHVLGLPHVPNNKQDIMSPSTDDPFSQVITCLDKKRLCDIWGCDSRCQ